MSDDEDDAPALPAGKRSRVPAARKAVVNKLWSAARRQLAAHEARLDGLAPGAAASESEAKALAILARTVRELVALEASTSPQATKASDELSAAAGLKHVAALRAELALRLEKLAAAPADPAAAGAAGAGEP
ncbi:MAG: hypothetical protein ACK4VM_03625 [Bosea sp. (in: a-proteobacteria)]